MGEGRATIDITQCVDARYVGFQSLVDLNETTFVRFDPRRGEVESVRIGNSSGGHQQVRPAQRSLFVSCFYGQLDMTTLLDYAQCLAIQPYFDAIFAQNFSHLISHIDIL